MPSQSVVEAKDFAELASYMAHCVLVFWNILHWFVLHVQGQRFFTPYIYNIYKSTIILQIAFVVPGRVTPLLTPYWFHANIITFH